MIHLVIVPSCESHSIAVDQAVHKPVPDDDDDDDGDDDDYDGDGDDGLFKQNVVILKSQSATSLW